MGSYPPMNAPLIVPPPSPHRVKHSFETARLLLTHLGLLGIESVKVRGHQPPPTPPIHLLSGVPPPPPCVIIAITALSQLCNMSSWWSSSACPLLSWPAHTSFLCNGLALILCSGILLLEEPGGLISNLLACSILCCCCCCWSCVNV